MGQRADMGAWNRGHRRYGVHLLRELGIQQLVCVRVCSTGPYSEDGVRNFLCTSGKGLVCMSRVDMRVMLTEIIAHG